MEITPAVVAHGVKKQLSRHLLFIITFWLIVGIYAGVSQVRTILMQAFAIATGGIHLWEIVLFVSTLLGAAFFLGSVLEVIPWDLPMPGLLGRFVFRPCAGLADLLVTPVEKLLGWMAARRWRAGLPLLLLGFLMFPLGANPGGGRWFPLAGAICKNFATLFLSVGAAVVFLHKLLLPVADPQTDPQKVAVACCRYLAWLIVCMLIGESIWFVDGLGISGSYAGFTIWAFAHVGMILIVGASLVDYLHYHTGMPVRIIALTGAMIVMWYSQSPVRIGRYEKDHADDPQVRKAWYDHMVGRMRAMDQKKLKGPAVVVVASGGGSRAALFASLVLEQLSRTPMDIPSPGVVPIEGGGTWGEHILLISSVSGGSLATGHFVQRGGQPSRDLESLRTTSKDDLEAALKDAFADWIARLGDLPKNKDLKKAAEAALAKERKYNEYFDDMGTDFMGPVLRGTLTPVLARSAALSSFWTNRFGWGASSRFRGYTHEGTTSYKPDRDPAVLFNATDADKGTRVIIGFPPLPAKLLNCDFELLSGQERTPFEIGELSPSLELSLAEAVRLSANFPWGFQISQVEACGGEKLHLLDGGVVDNGGIDSVNYVFRGVAMAAKANDDRAIELMGLLKARGVLVVEIDSGAKPSYTSATGPWAWATEPSRALSNSAFTAADLSRDFHKKGLQEILRPPGRRRRSASGVGLEPVLWSTLRCNHWDPDTDVMTAWALGPKDKAVILTRFLVEWEQWNRDQLKTEALALRTAQEAVTETATAQTARDMKAKLEKSGSDEVSQRVDLTAALTELDRQSKELQTIQSVAERDLKPNFEKALKTLEDGKKALSGVKVGERDSLKDAAKAWSVAAPTADTKAIEGTQQAIGELRDQRQQRLQNSLDFFQMQQKAKN